MSASLPVGAQRVEPEQQAGGWGAASARPGGLLGWLEVGLYISGRGALHCLWHGPLPLPSRGTGGDGHSAVGPGHREICQQFWNGHNPQPLWLRECSLTHEAASRQFPAWLSLQYDWSGDMSYYNRLSALRTEI